MPRPFGGPRWNLHPGLIGEAWQFSVVMFVSILSEASLLDFHGAAVDSAIFVGGPRAGAMRAARVIG